MIEAHTVKAFDDDMDELRASVAELGGWAETCVGDAVYALQRVDGAVAARAIACAGRVKSLAREVEQRGIRLIALRAPRADDLREVLTAMKVVDLIERIAAHGRSIAASVAALEGGRTITAPPAMRNLAALSTEAIRNALDAFSARDADASPRAADASDEAETLYGGLLHECLAHMRQDPRSISAAAALLFAGRSLARTADQAAEIARAVHFSVTGNRRPDRRREHADLLACGA
jgi:phosphate transport system protein